jgi:hypothetical protein
MTDDTPMTLDEAHRTFAKELFNHVWTLLESGDRTPEQDDEMIHAAHASRYHWGMVGEPVNLARGEWMISRVYVVLGRIEPALHHGRRCLELCTAHELGGFDLGFAHEAIARATAANGDDATAREQVALARAAATHVEKDEDRDYFLGDLATIPGYADLVAQP